MNTETIAAGTEDGRRPALRRHFGLRWNDARQGHLLVGPETVVVLNDTGAAIIRLCDGRHSVDDIVDALSTAYTEVNRDEVVSFLSRLYRLQLADE